MKGQGKLRWIIDGSSARLNGKGNTAVRLLFLYARKKNAATAGRSSHGVRFCCPGRARLLSWYVRMCRT